MNTTTSPLASPATGVWKRFLLLVPLVLVLALASYVYVRSQVGVYTVQGVIAYTNDDMRAAEMTFSNPDVVEVESIGRLNPKRFTASGARVRFRALKDGQTEATLKVGDTKQTWWLEVRDGAIIEGGINFEGWEAVEVCLLVFLAVLAGLFVSVVVELWRVAWYGYTMVACGGGFLFCAFQFLLYAMLFVRGSNPSFYFFLVDVTSMVQWFSAFSIFFMGPLALLVSISNVSLIRHEGFRPVNVLGMAASVVWLAVYVIYVLGPLEPHGILIYVYALLPVAMAYGECLLLSTMLCAWLSSRHVPTHGADYLMVLGCGIRANGTPSPLLAGRVDRAVAFDEARVAAGDAPAVYVPSGGQGPDEPVSEARSMADYLVAHKGVSSERIALEDRSATTRQNMAFSREVIERYAGRDANELQVVFSTTNYHVFRGYVCAHRAGMAVEGLGARTKYYFWPNAFLREFVGLLVARRRAIIQTFLIISVFYLLVTHALSLAIG